MLCGNCGSPELQLLITLAGAHLNAVSVFCFFLSLFMLLSLQKAAHLAGELEAFPLSSACYNLTTCVDSCLVPSAAHSFEKINILTEGIRFKSHQSDVAEILNHFHIFFFVFN